MFVLPLSQTNWQKKAIITSTSGYSIRQETCWLIRLNDDPRLDNLADFEARFAQLTVERREDGTFYVNDPQYGEVFFQPNGCVFGQGRLLDPDSWTISGDSHELPL